jgi:hypothetical protein
MPEGRLTKCRAAYPEEAWGVQGQQMQRQARLRETPEPHAHDWRLDPQTDLYVCGCGASVPGIRRPMRWD